MPSIPVPSYFTSPESPPCNTPSTPQSHREISAKKIEKLIASIKKDVDALVHGTDTNINVFHDRKVSLRKSLDHLSVLVINMTPTAQRRMLQYWESRDISFWDRPCVLWYGDDGEVIEVIMNRSKFEKLPESQEEIRDESGEIIQEKIYVRERILLTLLGNISTIDIAHAFHRNFAS